MLISMKINKFLSATLNTTLKYDNDVKTFDDNGTKHGAKVQFKEILGVGLVYNFYPIGQVLHEADIDPH